MSHICHRKKLNDFGAENWPKLKKIDKNGSSLRDSKTKPEKKTTPEKLLESKPMDKKLKEEKKITLTKLGATEIARNHYENQGMALAY